MYIISIRSDQADDFLLLTDGNERISLTQMSLMTDISVKIRDKYTRSHLSKENSFMGGGGSRAQIRGGSCQNILVGTGGGTRASSICTPLPSAPLLINGP